MADRSVEKLKFSEDTDNNYIITDPNAIRINENQNIILGTGTQEQPGRTDQLVLGKYNDINSEEDYVVMVGGGIEEDVKNIYTLSTNGNGYYDGSLEINKNLKVLNNTLTVDNEGVSISRNSQLKIGSTILTENILNNVSNVGENIKKLKNITSLNKNTINLNREFYLWTNDQTPITYFTKNNTEKIFTKSDIVLVDSEYFYIIYSGADIFRISREIDSEIGVPTYERIQFIGTNSDLYDLRDKIYGSGCITTNTDIPEDLESFLSKDISHYLISNNSDHICFIDKENIFINEQKSNSSNFISFDSASKGATKIGQIFYNEMNNKFYATGIMSRNRSGYNSNSTVYNIYELKFTIEERVVEGVLQEVKVFKTIFKGKYGDPTKPFLSIVQNATMNDGYLYIGFSNPNGIMVVNLKNLINIDQETEDVIFPIENIVEINSRMDNILPIGELQGCCYNDGRLYISGYVSETLSGITQLTPIGSVSVEGKDFINHIKSLQWEELSLYVDATLENGHIGGENLAEYVARTETYQLNTNSDIPTGATEHQFIYDRYKTANGLYSNYDYLPFYFLWEAIEASIGYFFLSGKKSTICIASDTDGSNHHWVSVPGWAVKEIRGYRPAYVKGVTKSRQALRTDYLEALSNYLTKKGGTEETDAFEELSSAYNNRKGFNEGISLITKKNTYPLVKSIEIKDGSVTLTRIGFTGKVRSASEIAKLTALSGPACLSVNNSIVTLKSCQFLKTGTAITEGMYESLIRTEGSCLFCHSFGDIANWNKPLWTNGLPNFGSNGQTEFIHIVSGIATYRDDTISNINYFSDTTKFPRSIGNFGILISDLNKRISDLGSQLDSTSDIAASAYNRCNTQEEINRSYNNRLTTNLVDSISIVASDIIEPHTFIARQKDDMVFVTLRFQIKANQSFGSDYIEAWRGLPAPMNNTFFTLLQATAGKAPVLIQVDTNGHVNAMKGEPGYYQGTFSYIAQ